MFPPHRLPLCRSLSWSVFVVPCRALRVVLRLRRHWGLLHCLSLLPVLLPLRNDVLSHVSKKNLEKKRFGSTAAIPKLGTRGVRCWSSLSRFDFSTQRTNRLRKFPRRGATSPMTETLSLLAPNVSVSAKVLLQRVGSCALSTSLSTDSYTQEYVAGTTGSLTETTVLLVPKRLPQRGVWPSRGFLVKEMSVMSCCPRHSHLPRNSRTHDEGVYSVGSIHDQDQAVA